MTDYNLITDEQGIRDLRQLRASVAKKTGTKGSRRVQSPRRSQIIVEITTDLPEDDFGTYAAKQVKLSGGEWEFVREVQVRKITKGAISAGTEEEPVRLFANNLSNLGWVVGSVSRGEEEDPPVVSASSCCGCFDEGDYPTYDWGNGEEPVVLAVSGVSLECGNGGGVRLKRDVPNGSIWDFTDDGPEGDVVWTYSGGDIITATHSSHGVVGRYEANEEVTDLLCSQKFTLDESVTPSNNRDCINCGREICVSPARAGISYDCMEHSQHNGELPVKWVLRIQGSQSEVAEQCTLPHLTYDNTYEFLTEGIWGSYCGWSLRLGGIANYYWVLLHTSSPLVWQLYYHSRTVTDQIGGAGSTLFKTWTDGEFQSFGPNAFRRTLFGQLTQLGCPEGELYQDVTLTGLDE